VLKSENGSLGLVPTMGSLHEGHLSLIKRSISENRHTAVSIFVNPTQFNDEEDFASYPRDLDADLEILEEYPVDPVFAPHVKEIYPQPDTRIFNFGGLDRFMEGKHRPGHFNGVAQVVSKLFSIIEPDKAYFGEKDFQQMMIIRKITTAMDFPVRIVGCPIVREPDGLAMSSRNKLLSAGERKSASRIPEALGMARDNAGKTSVRALRKKTIEHLQRDPVLKVEYFEIVDEQSLKPVQNWTEKGRIRGCIAVKVGKIRLIDNMDFSL
jgi:pantoate--beta-alanine ligase